MTIAPRLASGLVIVACGVGSQACVHWTANDPRLVRGETPAVYRNCTSTAAYFELARFDLASHIGQPFPDLTMIGRDKEARRLSSYRGKRLAVLIAGQCPTTAMWLKELGGQGWAIPPGFDELLLLVPDSPDRHWNRMVLECPTTHYVGWPLEGYLEIVRWNPILYEVGADGTFEGFWDYDEFAHRTRKYLLGTAGPAETEADRTLR